MIERIKNVFGWLGMVFGAMSVVVLANLLLKFQYAKFTGAVVGFYHRVLNVMFGWADPYLAQVVAAIGGVFELTWVLYPHWKYVFVLLWVYLSGDARANWSIGRHKWAVIFFVWGLIVALMASIGTGLVPIDSSQGLSDVKFFPVEVFPIVGIVLFELGKNVLVALLQGPSRPSTVGKPFWKAFPTLVATYTLPMAVLASPFIVVSLSEGSLSMFNDHATRSFVILVSFIVASGIMWLARGYVQTRYAPGASEDWKVRFEKSASTGFGRWILYTIGGALLFIATNAGLNLLGL